MSASTGTAPKQSIVSRLQRAWRLLGAPPEVRKVPGSVLVALAAGLLGLAASAVTVPSGWAMAYSDAQSHLTIARRVIDSMAPGFEQLGTVWLPVPHLLLIPLVAIDPLFHTGWAAALLGSAALSGTAAGLYRIAARLGIGRAGRLAMLVLLLANPSVLYLYTTALTEPVLLLFLVAALSGLSRWALAPRRMSAGELAVFAGIPTAAAMLSRYEGWMLSLTGTIFVCVVTLRRTRSLQQMIIMAVGYAWIPALAVCWWLAYNWGIYGDPLEFMFGPYSASAQQSSISSSGLLPTKGNLGLTLLTFHSSVLGTAGVLLLVLAGAGLLVAAYRWRLQTPGLVLWLTASAYVFAVVSMYLGQTAINNAHSLPSTWWNNRFAMTAMPFFLLAAALAVDAAGQWLTRKDNWRLQTRRVLRAGAAAGLGAAVLLQLGWWIAGPVDRAPVLAEAAMSAGSTRYSTEAAQWLAQNYDGGGLLLDESARGNAIVPLLGIDISQIFLRASGDNFTQALDNPAAHARWVLLNVEKDGAPVNSGPVDLVDQAFIARPSARASYRTVYTSPTHAVLQRIDR